MVARVKTLAKKRLRQELDFEELTAEEEEAIEKGRKAYVEGDWKSFNQVKNALGNSHNRARTKKS